MIFPDLVFGRSSAQMIDFGLASLPIRVATCSRISAATWSLPSRSPFSVTKATIAWPVKLSGSATTAASATFSCATMADSTSAVDSR